MDEQLAKALDRKVWLPSGGSLVIDRTEAMTVIDVNTGKYTGSGGNLEQTVTRNNLEAAEEIVRQLRLRDLGGIVVIDFIDMVLESNRELVLRRLTECLGRDRTKHQVAEVTSLGLVQMTRKRVGEGLLEAFSEPCEHCHGRGVIVHMEPVDKKSGGNGSSTAAAARRNGRPRAGAAGPPRRRHRPSRSTEAENTKRRAAASADRGHAAAEKRRARGRAPIAAHRGGHRRAGRTAGRRPTAVGRQPTWPAERPAARPISRQRRRPTAAGCRPRPAVEPAGRGRAGQPAAASPPGRQPAGRAAERDHRHRRLSRLAGSQRGSSARGRPLCLSGPPMP